jgi:hypothetical protein
MKFTRRQYGWTAMIGAGLLALALSGCTTVRPGLPPLPKEWSEKGTREHHGDPCVVDGQAHLSCPPMA